jgi:hypothetical protein
VRTGLLWTAYQWGRRATLSQPQGEPSWWAWQNDETGNKGCIDKFQLDNGFLENNPRLSIIAELYTAPTQFNSDKIFYSGVEYACELLVNLYDQPTMAEEVLNAARLHQPVSLTQYFPNPAPTQTVRPVSLSELETINECLACIKYYETEELADKLRAILATREAK